MSSENRGRHSLPARFRATFAETFRSLRNPNFRRYSIGQIVSVSGTWMQSTAIGWLVYKLTGSSAALGLVSFAGMAPILFLSVFAGGFADRHDRRRIMMTVQIVGFIQATTLAILTMTGAVSVPAVVALALFLGTAVAFDVPARQAFVADLAGPEEMVNAISLNSAIFNVSRMLGPVLAGILIGWIGEAVCFLLNGLSYAFAFVMLRSLEVEAKTARKPDARGSLDARRLWELMRKTGVADILVLTAAISIFGFQFAVLMPVIVDKLLAGGAAQLGYLTSAVGVGALFGSLAMASRGKSERLSRWLGFATLGLAGALVVIAWSQFMLVSCLASAFAGLCISLHFTGGNSLVQTSVDEAVRGRVLGIYSFFLIGLAPIGSLLAGWAAHALGVSSAITIAALVLAAAAAFYFLRLGGRLAGGPST